MSTKDESKRLADTVFADPALHAKFTAMAARTLTTEPVPDDMAWVNNAICPKCEGTGIMVYKARRDAPFSSRRDCATCHGSGLTDAGRAFLETEGGS